MQSPLQHERGCIIGLQSACNGIICFNGVFHTFIIQFKANGYNKLFRLPAKELVDKRYYMDDVFGNAAKTLNERLQHAACIQGMAGFADRFLLQFLSQNQKTAQVYDGITFVANELFTNAPLLTIEAYASKANMSARNFGRRFMEHVGISPKFYCRLLRFNKAVITKIKKTTISWTSIAQECGYNDQMHMIRDFKQFADVNPAELFHSAEGFTRSRIDATQKSDHVFGDLNSNLQNEKFITVERTAF